MDHSPKPSITVKRQILSVSSDTLNLWLSAFLRISSDLNNESLVLKFYPR